MNVHVAATNELVGVGIYEPSEAGRLTGIQPRKLRRWLRGHQADDRDYAPLWTPQIDVDDERLYLGFRDLTEARVVAALIASGVPAQKVRKAIEIARERYGFIRPLSTRRFRTDGKSIFMLTGEDGDDDRLIDLLRDQYTIRRVIEPSFKGLEFDEGDEPTRWRMARGIVLDPAFSFGQPIDEKTRVPTAVLSRAAQVEGSAEAAAEAYSVPVQSVRQAVAFEEALNAGM